MDEIDSFLSFLISVKGESDNTKIGYENDLRQFEKYLKRLDLDYQDVTSSDAREYVRLLMEKFKERSMLRKLYQGSLKRFAAALYDGGALDKGEVAELRAYLEGLEGKEGQ